MSNRLMRQITQMPKGSSSPNLFSYASSELSQDAMICWLMAWAGTTNSSNLEDEALRQCGRLFVNKLFAKWNDRKEVSIRDQICIEIKRQESGIDILARVDRHNVLLIEDKTGTGAHDNQLQRYKKLISDGSTAFGTINEECLFPIYLKTGNMSPSERRRVENEGFRLFDRKDLLDVLNVYRGQNAILLDFRRHLTQFDQQTQSFIHWTVGEGRTQLGWEGLYAHLERRLSNEAGRWEDLTSTQRGGYIGFSFIPNESSKNCRFAMWVEKERISFRLYGTINTMDGEKHYWTNAFTEQSSGLFVKPRKLKATKTKPMCVSEWRPRGDSGWLTFGNDGKFNIAASIENLIHAIRILQTTILKYR